MSKFDEQFNTLQTQATEIGRRYIYLMCQEKIEDIEEHDRSLYQSLVDEWKERHDISYVPPETHDLVLMEYHQVLKDKEYVESTMKDLMCNVADKKSKKTLLVDDVRSIEGVTAIARTPAIAKRLLETEMWDRVILDHDLGDKETGYDVLAWALEYGIAGHEVQLITDNPTGKRKMSELLGVHGYQTEDGNLFY